MKRHGRRDPVGSVALARDLRRMNDPLMPRSVTLTLRLKVKRDAYPWLNAAAVE